jgi:OFA family oxalate/formate antiporter-like MFS transporter
MKTKNASFYGWSVILASWLAVFSLFGYRATFAILKGPMATSLGWTTSQITLGYSLMMVLYALAAYFSGLILDKWGSKPVYAIAAVLGSLGFLLTARVDSHLAYLFTFGFVGGVATGMLWVTSTVSVRKWYVGKSYATMWGIAFSGAPMAQFVLAQVVKPTLSRAQAALDLTVGGLIPNSAAMAPKELSLAVAAKLQEPATRLVPGVKHALGLLDTAWRTQMTILGVIVFLALAVAVIAAKNAPEHYDMKPFGAIPAAAGAVSVEQVWTIKEAFSKYAIWAAILMFLTSMMAEFLIWTQVVSYWTEDVGFTLAKAINIYGLIGLIGIFSMPIMGKVADRIVQTMGNEVKGRKTMLMVGPATGAVACLLLLATPQGDIFAYIACFIFAVYWAIVPGGVVGYVGAIYGRKTLGKIWGLATMIVMGIGPFLGTYVGAELKDISGSYTYSLYFALFAFVVSVLVAIGLPLKAEYMGGKGLPAGSPSTDALATATLAAPGARSPVGSASRKD